jgi:hypothetical protein
MGSFSTTPKKPPSTKDETSCETPSNKSPKKKSTKSKKKETNVEIVMDATKVNTKGGWRDMKVAIDSKRLLGEGVDISYWDKRTRKMLPEVSARVAFENIAKRLDELSKEERTDDERESLRLLRGYLEHHRERLCYRERLLEGRAIGRPSGARGQKRGGQVEGACKSMIGRRLKQSGARWLDERLNEMAVLCSVHYSDLWEKYWTQAN